MHSYLDDLEGARVQVCEPVFHLGHVLGAKEAFVHANFGADGPEALAAGLDDELADTLNSLGNLRQRQKRFAEAEALYWGSLTLRKQREEGSEEQTRAKQQAIARSSRLDK